MIEQASPPEEPSTAIVGEDLSPTFQMTHAVLPEAGIRIEYSGKLSIRVMLGKLRPRVQRRQNQLSHGSEEDQSRNLVVEGDNLQVMASLYRYRGQIDLIIADPPYNTGNDFRYNDRWADDPNDPDPGTLVTLEDGSRHTKWMQFMGPRLTMMKAMLKPGGVCAVCIDERELFRLGMLMDEVFGESNRIAIINWQKSYSAKNDSAHVSTATEYVLVYAKVKDKAKTALLGRTELMNARYGSPDGDPDEWTDGDLSAKSHPKLEDYGIQSPFTGVIHYPPGSRRWARSKAEIKKNIERWGSDYIEMKDPHSTLPSLVLKGTVLINGTLNTPEPILHIAHDQALKIRDSEVWPEIIFLSNGEGRIRVKRYLKKVKKGSVPMTFWADEDYEEPLVLESQSWSHTESGHSQSGINELSAVVGPKHSFETVKPLKLISKIIQIWCPSSGLVLDPFAGSGTTGHAVLNLNYETETSRRFILIEQSRSARNDNYARTLLADRLRRVLTGNWASGQRPPIPGGFTFKTSTSQIDRQAVLAMQREEMADLVLMSHWDVQTRKGPLLTTMVHKGYKYLVAKDVADNGYFLVWDGPNERTPLTMSIFSAIVEEAKREKLSAPYHVYARTSHIHSPNLFFYKIPDEILSKIGFNDAFGMEDEL